MTRWAMYSLSAPTTLASRALRRYLDSGQLPDLPVGYTDRVGRRLADVQYTIERLDKAVRSLEDLATRDHLTGTYNRRAADERLAEDVKRAERGGGALSLTLLDLDQLKPMNDAHGHRAGDACVVHFAEVLSRNVRAGDWIARWGGDEFVVGMWYIQEGQPTERVLERIAEDLRESPAVLPDREETLLTFSAGTCPWKTGGRRPWAGLEGRRSPLQGQGRGREYHRTPRLVRFANVGRSQMASPANVEAVA